MSAVLSMVLAGAAVVPAAPVAPNTWFSSKEYSKTALQVAERGGIAYTIDVAPDGTPLRCAAKGRSALDAKVCEIVMKSARFVPAKDDQGRPVHGVHDGMASFLMPGNKGRPDRSRLTIAVERLPEGVASPAFARVAFMVDAAGAISQCASTAGERRRFMQTVEALGPAACEAVAKDYRPPVARDAAGGPVASIQSVQVRFEVGQTGL